jgi:hypothetical protein
MNVSFSRKSKIFSGFPGKQSIFFLVLSIGILYFSQVIAEHSFPFAITEVNSLTCSLIILDSSRLNFIMDLLCKILGCIRMLLIIFVVESCPLSPHSFSLILNYKFDFHLNLFLNIFWTFT